ncbi:MAG: hypothetical protein IH986_05110 [Planctomycetes bacterium]|nr:hypothetical protein [Planctomycetota bacterium]
MVRVSIAGAARAGRSECIAGELGTDAGAEALEERIDVGTVESAVGVHVAKQRIAIGKPHGVRRRIAEGQEERIDVGAVEGVVTVQVALGVRATPAAPIRPRLARILL